LRGEEGGAWRPVGRGDSIVSPLSTAVSASALTAVPCKAVDRSWRFSAYCGPMQSGRSQLALWRLLRSYAKRSTAVGALALTAVPCKAVDRRLALWRFCGPAQRDPLQRALLRRLRPDAKRSFAVIASAHAARPAHDSRFLGSHVRARFGAVRRGGPQSSARGVRRGGRNTTAGIARTACAASAHSTLERPPGPLPPGAIIAIGHHRAAASAHQRTFAWATA
jgi:hypothetical protein